MQLGHPLGPELSLGKRVRPCICLCVCLCARVHACKPHTCACSVEGDKV